MLRKSPRGTFSHPPRKGKGGIARAIYVTASGERVVVVHAFTKKAQKTPARALETARVRVKEVV